MNNPISFDLDITNYRIDKARRNCRAGAASAWTSNCVVADALFAAARTRMNVEKVKVESDEAFIVEPDGIWRAALPGAVQHLIETFDMWADGGKAERPKTCSFTLDFYHTGLKPEEV